MTPLSIFISQVMHQNIVQDATTMSKEDSMEQNGIFAQIRAINVQGRLEKETGPKAS